MLEGKTDGYYMTRHCVEGETYCIPLIFYYCNETYCTPIVRIDSKLTYIHTKATAT